MGTANERRHYIAENIQVTLTGMEYIWGLIVFNSSPPGQNGRHFADDIFGCIFVNEKFYILIKILLKFVPNGSNDYDPTSVEVMAWCRKGDKPLSEPMQTKFTDPYMPHWGEMS